MVLTRQRSQLPQLGRWEAFPEVPARFAQLFDEFLYPMRPAGMTWVPVVDVIEKDEELLLTAELPGMAEKDVQLEIENNILTLKGEKKQEKEEKTEKYHCWERTFGAFERSFAIPGSVDPTKIKADFKEGVLEVHMPKTAVAKGRKIEIGNK